MTEASVRLHVLGEFRLARDGFAVSTLPRKAQSLLAFLTLHPEPHPREKLAALLWGDSPDRQARASLRTALKTLREQLGEQLLSADRQRVQINPAFPFWIDAREFQQATLSPAAPDSLAAAIDLYRGDLLADFYDEWILAEREQYQRQYREALLQLIQTSRAASEYERAIAYARKVLAVDTANEPAYQHLMFCYLALGERGAALQLYEACARALQTELAVEPSRETTELYQWIKQAPLERAAPAARITNLPIPPSSFIGRKREMAEVKRLLTEDPVRLLTLVGPGGGGKTRLAIQAATDLIDRFPDGVWWVDLAPLMDETLTPEAVARALGVRESPNQTLTETVTDFLQHRQLLLVLDNCEQLILACARLADVILAHCANVRILATSRETLGIAGETVYPVPSLSLPTPQGVTLTGLLMEYEGIRLFVERAAAVNSDFSLTPQNATAVLRICQQLDGIPLALELAAARTRLLSVEQIAERLDDRFNLLTQGSRSALPRQQTLRATLDWSYDLLSGEQRLLLRRLSVFAGSFSLEAVGAICSEEPLPARALLELLARLVDRSLVQVEQPGADARYRLLETIRAYARSKAAECGETQRLRSRHRDFFITFAEQAAPKLKGADQFEWLGRLDCEHDNLRAAWDCAAESDSKLALRLASALLHYWLMRGNRSEGRAWLTILLERSRSWGQTSRRARVLGLAGRLAYVQEDFAVARELLAQALNIARIASDQAEIAFALLWLGRTAYRQRDAQTARALTEECLKIYEQLHDSWGAAIAELHLASVADEQDRPVESEAQYLRSLAKLRALGDKFWVGNALNGLGQLAWRQGDYERAGQCFEENIEILRGLRSRFALVIPTFNLAWVSLHGLHYGKAKLLFAECLQLYKEDGNRSAMAGCVAGFAAILGMMGKPAKAAWVFGAVTALFETIGLAGLTDAADQHEFEHYLALVRAQVTEASYTQMWAEGRATVLRQDFDHALEQVTDFALENMAADVSEPPGST